MAFSEAPTWNYRVRLHENAKMVFCLIMIPKIITRNDKLTNYGSQRNKVFEPEKTTET